MGKRNKGNLSETAKRLREGIFAENNDSAKVVKNRIKELRLAKGLSRVALAKELGVNEVMLYKIESQKANLTAESMVVSARFFNCSIDDILDIPSASKSQREEMSEALIAIIKTANAALGKGE